MSGLVFSRGLLAILVVGLDKDSHCNLRNSVNATGVSLFWIGHQEFVQKLEHSLGGWSVWFRNEGEPFGFSVVLFGC